LRVLIRLGLAGFAIFFVGLAAFFVYFDVIAGASIERAAAYTLGVETRVGFVRIGFLTGTLRIGSLEIDNPPGFESKRLMELGDGRLEVSLGSLRQPVVEVPSLTLDRVKVSLEKARGTTNFGKVLANLQRFEKSGSPSPSQESQAAGPAKRFIVREVVIRDISAHVVHTEGIGALGKFDIAVPEIRLKNVGAHNATGVVMSELTNILTKAIFEAIVKQGANLPDFLSADLRNGLAGVSDVSIQMVEDAAGAVTQKLPGSLNESAGKLGGEAQKKALDGIGRLFGGKRDGE